MSCCTIFIMHDVHSVCYVNTDFRSLTITCIIYTCCKCLACESKVASILNSIVGSSVGVPTELPTISILESSGLPTELPTKLPTISVYGSSGQPDLHGKIPMGSTWAAHSTVHWAAHFFMFGSSGLPTAHCFHIWKKWAALFAWQYSHGQSMGSPLRCPLSYPLLSYLEVVGCLLSCPLFPYMEAKSRKYQGLFEVKSRVKTWQGRGIWSQQLEH